MNYILLCWVFIFTDLKIQLDIPNLVMNIQAKVTNSQMLFLINIVLILSHILLIL